MIVERDRLSSEGVSADDIDAVLEAIARTVADVFEEYDVDTSEREAVVEAVQTAILRKVIEFGEELDDRTVPEQFEMLVEDFSGENDTAAWSNVVFALGTAKAELDDPPEALTHISGAILARNHSHAE